MSDIVRLVWTLKSDPHCELDVFNCWTKNGMMGLQDLARILYKTGFCKTIGIYSATGHLIEDWSKGNARTSTDVFNEQLAEVLERPGGPHEREQKLKEENRELKNRLNERQ